MPIIDRLKQLEEQIEPGATIFFNLDDPTLLQGDRLSDPSWVALFERLYRAHCRVFALSSLQDSIAQKTLIDQLHEQHLYFSSLDDINWPDGVKMASGVLFLSPLNETMRSSISSSLDIIQHKQPGSSRSGDPGCSSWATPHPEIKVILYLMNRLYLNKNAHLTSHQIVHIDQDEKKSAQLLADSQNLEFQARIVPIQFQSVCLLKSDDFTRPPLQETFSPDLTKLRYVTHLTGGSGGVYVFIDEATQKKYALKTASSLDHLKTEILTNAIFMRLGLPVPRFNVYASLPETMSALLPGEVKETELFQLAEFIEPASCQTNKNELAKATLKHYFALFSLLAFRDAKLENLLVNTSEEILICDAGSAFTFRACGDETQLENLIDIAALRTDLGRSSYLFSELKQDEIKEQIKTLLTGSALHDIYEVMREVHRHLFLSTIQTLFDYLQKRTLSLYRCLSPQESMEEKSEHFDEQVVEGRDSASLCYLIHSPEGRLSALLGKRRGSNTLCTSGGKADASDKNLMMTVLRETFEELGMILPPGLSLEALLNAPYCDLIQKGTQRHRMFFVVYHALSMQEITDFLEHSNDTCNKQNNPEMSDWQLIELSLLLDAEQHALPLFPDFRVALEHTRVKHILSALSQGKTLSPNRFVDYKEIAIQHRDDEKVHLIQRRKLLRAIKEDPRFFISPDKPGCDYFSPSEMHLRHIMQDFDSTTEQLVFNYLTSHSSAAPHKIEQLQQQILSMLQIERQHPGEVFLYHTVSQDIAFIYAVIQALYQFIQINKHAPMFRTVEKNFRGFHSAMDVFSYFVEKLGMPSTGHNYHKNFPDYFLAANFLLFGSRGSLGSDTIKMFISNRANNPLENSRALLELLSTSLELPDIAIEYLNGLYTQYKDRFTREGESTAIYQLILNKQHHNKIYVCHKLGVLPEKKTDILSWYQALLNGTSTIDLIFLHSLQVRFLAKPTPSTVKVFPHYHNLNFHHLLSDIQAAVTNFIGPLVLIEGKLLPENHPSLREREAIFLNQSLALESCIKFAVLALLRNKKILARNYLVLLHQFPNKQEVLFSLSSMICKNLNRIHDLEEMFASFPDLKDHFFVYLIKHHKVSLFLENKISTIAALLIYIHDNDPSKINIDPLLEKIFLDFHEYEQSIVMYFDSFSLLLKKASPAVLNKFLELFLVKNTLDAIFLEHKKNYPSSIHDCVEKLYINSPFTVRLQNYLLDYIEHVKKGGPAIYMSWLDLFCEEFPSVTSEENLDRYLNIYFSHATTYSEIFAAITTTNKQAQAFIRNKFLSLTKLDIETGQLINLYKDKRLKNEPALQEKCTALLIDNLHSRINSYDLVNIISMILSDTCLNKKELYLNLLKIKIISDPETFFSVVYDPPIDQCTLLFSHLAPYLTKDDKTILFNHIIKNFNNFVIEKDSKLAELVSYCDDLPPIQEKIFPLLIAAFLSRGLLSRFFFDIYHHGTNTAQVDNFLKKLTCVNSSYRDGNFFTDTIIQKFAEPLSRSIEAISHLLDHTHSLNLENRKSLSAYACRAVEHRRIPLANLRHFLAHTRLLFQDLPNEKMNFILSLPDSIQEETVSFIASLLQDEESQSDEFIEALFNLITSSLCLNRKSRLLPLLAFIYQEKKPYELFLTHLINTFTDFYSFLRIRSFVQPYPLLQKSLFQKMFVEYNPNNSEKYYTVITSCQTDEEKHLVCQHALSFNITSVADIVKLELLYSYDKITCTYLMDFANQVLKIYKDSLNGNQLSPLILGVNELKALTSIIKSSPIMHELFADIILRDLQRLCVSFSDIDKLLTLFDGLDHMKLLAMEKILALRPALKGKPSDSRSLRELPTPHARTQSVVRYGLFSGSLSLEDKQNKGPCILL